jgi:hypothetical protein
LDIFVHNRVILVAGAIFSTLLPMSGHICIRAGFASMAFFGVAATEAGGAAAVEGMVDLGDPPRRQRAVKRYSTGAGAEKEASPPRPPAVVYLEGNFGPTEEPATDSEPRMLQKNLQFQPLVLPVQVGVRISTSADTAALRVRRRLLLKSRE